MRRRGIEPLVRHSRALYRHSGLRPLPREDDAIYFRENTALKTKTPSSIRRRGFFACMRFQKTRYMAASRALPEF